MWLDSTSPSQHRALHASPVHSQLVVLTEKKHFKPLIQYKSYVLAGEEAELQKKWTLRSSSTGKQDKTSVQGLLSPNPGLKALSSFEPASLILATDSP